MTTKMDDVSLEVRLDVGKLSRDVERADKAIKQKDAKREREKDQKEKRKRRKEMRRNVLGAGGDVLRGRVPGPQRFGGRAARTAAKVAGLLAVVKGVELLATAFQEAPIVGAIARPIAKTLKGAGASLRSGLTAWEETKDYVLGQKVAGRPIGNVSKFYEQRAEIARFLAQPDVLRELMTGSETAPLIITLLRDVFLTAIKTMGSELVRELIGPLKDIFFDDDEVKQEIDRRVDTRIKQTTNAPAGGFR